jgi:hypothetical protein
LLVNNTLGILSKQIEEEINACTDTTVPITPSTNVTPPSDLVSTIRLKKKEVQTKTSKRIFFFGLISCTSPQRREVRREVKKRKMVQRYMITQNIFDSL